MWPSGDDLFHVAWETEARKFHLGGTWPQLNLFALAAIFEFWRSASILRGGLVLIQYAVVGRSREHLSACGEAADFV